MTLPLPLTEPLPPCDHDVYERGTVVHTLPSCDMTLEVERVVREVSRLSGQKVDWHPSCGQFLVKALGDLGPVYTALDELKDALGWLRAMALGCQDTLECHITEEVV